MLDTVVLELMLCNRGNVKKHINIEPIIRVSSISIPLCYTLPSIKASNIILC